MNRYKPHVRMSDVVILSPYREQRSKITELLKGAYENVPVTTVTKSQGKALLSHPQAAQDQDVNKLFNTDTVTQHTIFKIEIVWEIDLYPKYALIKLRMYK